MKIVCISDTHNKLDEVTVPDGDVLVHAGDGTMRGKPREIQKLANDLRMLPHKTKIFVAGNHDWGFQTARPESERMLTDAGVIYLEDTSVNVAGKIFYGSPWQPEFCGWAFNAPRGHDLRKIWSKIPARVDVLITHGPPKHMLDMTPRGEAVGCDDLMSAVLRAQPRLHVFGHIHECYGVKRVRDVATTFVNAAVCDGRYDPVNAPIVIDL